MELHLRIILCWRDSRSRPTSLVGSRASLSVYISFITVAFSIAIIWMKSCQLYVFNAFGVIVGFAFMKIIIVNTLHDTCIIMLIIMEIYLIKQILCPKPQTASSLGCHIFWPPKLCLNQWHGYIRNLKKHVGYSLLWVLMTMNGN